jgi:cysteinyl-tRNA synthetase
MKLHNTLTRQLDTLQPLDGNTVKLYTCGLTVYDQPHIGNWVGYIYWDVLVRTLALEGYNVVRTQNYTDVGHLVSDDDSGEDKMEKGARQEGKTAWDVAQKYIEIAEHEGFELLGLQRPTHLGRATDFIPQQVAFVTELEKRGYTYLIPQEGVYFDTSKLSDYGKLARLDIDGLQAGARVSVQGKRNVTDFALWKFSPEDRQRDMEWDSPWGKGFPGWHLECSVIARQTLGDQIDIHTGGIDHIPVHHTNEIAQTEALTGKPFASFWVHNNHLKVEGRKMAKSLGNVYTLKDITDHGFSIEAFKLLVLSKHYRTEGNFTWEIMESAQNRLKSYQAMADLRWQATTHGKVTNEDIARTQDTVQAALRDDLNTPEALAAISQVEGVLDSGGISRDSQEAYGEFLGWLDEALGLSLGTRTDITDSQKVLLADRRVAREAADWQKADELRDTLQSQGLTVRDSAQGQIWSRN